MFPRMVLSVDGDQRQRMERRGGVGGVGKALGRGKEEACGDVSRSKEVGGYGHRVYNSASTEESCGGGADEFNDEIKVRISGKGEGNAAGKKMRVSPSEDSGLGGRLKFNIRGYRANPERLGRKKGTGVQSIKI